MTLLVCNVNVFEKIAAEFMDLFMKKYSHGRKKQLVTLKISSQDDSQIFPPLSKPLVTKAQLLMSSHDISFYRPLPHSKTFESMQKAS